MAISSACTLKTSLKVYTESRMAKKIAQRMNRTAGHRMPPAMMALHSEEAGNQPIAENGENGVVVEFQLQATDSKW